nr:unnamed protein product [Digitaria exilis]
MDLGASGTSCSRHRGGDVRVMWPCDGLVAGRRGGGVRNPRWSCDGAGRGWRGQAQVAGGRAEVASAPSWLPSASLSMIRKQRSIEERREAETGRALGERKERGVNDKAKAVMPGRPGSVQQQYRPRSPAGATIHGNATSSYVPAGSAAGAGHMEPVNQGSGACASLGSLDNVKPSEVAAQSDVLNSVSAEETWVADSSSPAVPTKGYMSPAFTLQFGTFSPGAINKKHTTAPTCTSSAPPDMNGSKHEKACHGLFGKPNTVSLSAQEQQTQEARDDLVIGGGADSIETYDSVHVPKLHETPVLNSISPTSKVCMDSCKVFPRTPSSPTQQQCENQEEIKDTVNANQSNTAYKYPATKPKISVQIPASYTPNMAPPQFMLPVPGRSMPVAFHQKQPQVPVEFRGAEVSSFKGLLPPSLSAPVHVDLKPPVPFPAENNEVSSKCSGESAMSNKQNHHKVKELNIDNVVTLTGVISQIFDKALMEPTFCEIAKDEEEVVLCMKELDAPSFYPSLVSLWINDSFERKDLERELLAKLLVFLCKSQENLLSQRQLLQGFQHVLSTLEDAVTDAPKATKFLGQIFAKAIMEDVISLTEIGGLLQERDGREEPGGRDALDDSLASEVLGSMLESIRVERGDSAVDEIRAKSSLLCPRLTGVCV